MGSSTVPVFPSTRIRNLVIMYDNRNFPSGLENIAALPLLTGLRVRTQLRAVCLLTLRFRYHQKNTPLKSPALNWNG